MFNIVGCYALSEEATVPFLGTELSACHDLCACLHNEKVKIHGRSEGITVENFGTRDAFIRLFPEDMALVPTGLIFCLPKRYFMDIRSRSGNTWKRFLTVANQPGTIDPDYTKETFVLLHNQSLSFRIIKTGDVIAQVKLNEKVYAEFLPIDEEQFKHFKSDIETESSRDGGLGSTDKNK